MSGPLLRARRTAGALRRRMFASPEIAAWRRACRLAGDVPRFHAGSIELMGYRIAYPDLLTLCPQWHDIFVAGSLAFTPSSDTPRILDCGANVGLASLYFKRLCPGARVTAYEADPAIFAMLCRNLADNGAADVEPVHAAVWNAAGTLTFRCEGSDSGMVAALPGTPAGTDAPVPSVRLRDVLASERAPVDLLKLDIEGAEDVVLADCEPVLDRVSALVMDLHEFDPADRQAPRVLERLSRAGFKYGVDALVAQPWRASLAASGAPFPGRALVWSMTVWAWRPERS